MVGRLRGLTLAVACCVLAVAGCGSGGSHGLAVHVDEKPFRISLIQNGKTVVAEDAGARLRYQVIPSGAQYHLTNVLSVRGNVYTVATNEPGRTATVLVQTPATGVDVTVALHPSGDVAAIYDAFGSSANDHFLGGGEQSSTVDLRGQIVPVEAGCTPVAVPYASSSAGWGVALNTQQIAALAFPGSGGGSGDCTFATPRTCTFPALTDRVEVCAQGNPLDERLYVGDFAQSLADYEHDEGKPRVPPESELALIKWRDVANGPQDLLEDVAKLQGAGIPIGWELLDNPWESCVGSLAFDRGRFPDPAGTIRAVHARGVRFMLWVSPLEQCDNGYPRSAFLGGVDQYVLDLRFQQSAVRTFETRLAKLLRLGVDGFKADRGDEVPFEDARLQNPYPLWYAQDVMSVLGRRAAIFRAGSLGSQAVVPGLWAGDQEGTFEGLQQAIRAAQSASMSGFPVWGSDVGGYHSQQLTAELFARWAQLGAVSPVLEVGGQGPNATPWTLGPGAMTALRAAATLHYELAPLFESLLARGEPVLRPLGFAFPDDAGSWSAQYELMVGPDLLAAPVTGGGTGPSVYLPPGSWIDLGTGATVDGGATFTRVTPDDVLPLYARAGAVVPFALRTPSDSWWATNELSHRGRAGFLATDGATLDLHGQPAGVQLFVPATARPKAVTLAGRSVPFTWVAGPLPGAVVRLHGPVVRGVVHVAAS